MTSYICVYVYVVVTIEQHQTAQTLCYPNRDCVCVGGVFFA